MRRRVVSSTDDGFGAPLNAEALKTISSEGMKMAGSFAVQVSLAAQFFPIQLFSSGTPHENGHLFCDTPARKDLLNCIEKASMISITLGTERSPEERSDPVLTVCTIAFRRDSEIIARRTYYFDRATGDCVSYTHHGGF